MRTDLENITLTLPRQLLRKLRVLAAQRNKSVSKILATEAEALISRSSTYRRALAAETKKMASGLYSVGSRRWSRDDLHARK